LESSAERRGERGEETAELDGAQPQLDKQELKREEEGRQAALQERLHSWSVAGESSMLEEEGRLSREQIALACRIIVNAA
jgi:hypothetical protein